MCNSMLRRAATGSDRLLPRMVLTRSCKERVDWPSWPTSCVDCEQPGRHQDVFPRFCLVRWLPALTAVSRACTLSDYFPTAIVKSRPNQLLAEWLLGWFRSEVLSAGDLVTANGLDLSCSFLGGSAQALCFLLQCWSTAGTSWASQLDCLTVGNSRCGLRGHQVPPCPSQLQLPSC